MILAIMMDHGIWQPDPEHASHTPPDFDNISCKPRLEPDLWHWAHSEVPEYPAISVWWWPPVASLFPRPAETNRLYPRGTHWGETMGARTCTLEESWGNPLWTTSLVCKVLLPRGSPFCLVLHIPSSVNSKCHLDFLLALQQIQMDGPSSRLFALH